MNFSRNVVLPLSVVGLTLALATTGSSAHRHDHPSNPATTDAVVTQLTTNLLESSQLAHHPFDRQLAGLFLDRYLDSLDGGRSLFVKADVDEFAGCRSTLARATHEGDTSVAQKIFHRYLERLEQRASYVTDSLQSAKFHRRDRKTTAKSITCTTRWRERSA